jgi:hypothetical protein
VGLISGSYAKICGTGAYLSLPYFFARTVKVCIIFRTINGNLPSVSILSLWSRHPAGRICQGKRSYLAKNQGRICRYDLLSYDFLPLRCQNRLLWNPPHPLGSKSETAFSTPAGEQPHRARPASSRQLPPLPLTSLGVILFFHSLSRWNEQTPTPSPFPLRIFSLRFSISQYLTLWSRHPPGRICQGKRSYLVKNQGRICRYDLPATTFFQPHPSL